MRPPPPTPRRAVRVSPIAPHWHCQWCPGRCRGGMRPLRSPPTMRGCQSAAPARSVPLTAATSTSIQRRSCPGAMIPPARPLLQVVVCVARMVTPTNRQVGSRSAPDSALPRSASTGRTALASWAIATAWRSKPIRASLAPSTVAPRRGNAATGLAVPVNAPTATPRKASTTPTPSAGGGSRPFAAPGLSGHWHSCCVGPCTLCSMSPLPLGGPQWLGPQQHGSLTTDL